MTEIPTRRKCLRVYEDVWQVGPSSDPDELVQDMRNIAAAPSLDAACEAIAYWNEQDSITLQRSRVSVARQRLRRNP